MNITDIIELHIDSVAFGGEGVGRINNTVVFVKNGLPNEDLNVKITEKKSNFYRAEIAGIIKKSPQRIAPECPYFNVCGGCQYLHASYSTQIEIKTGQIKEILERIGGLKNISIESIPSAKQLHYRNKIRLNIVRSAAGTELGFIGTNNTDIVPINSCLIAEDAINKKLPEIKEELNRIKERLPKTVTIRLLEKDHADYFFDPDAKENAARKILKAEIAGKTFEIPVTSFFQINTEMTSAMIEQTVSMLKNDGLEIIIDGYCGIGVFGIFLSPYGQEIIGIDSDINAIRCAVNNAKINKAGNVTHIAKRTEKVLKELLARSKGIKTGLILDPPREGCDRKVIEAIIHRKPEKIIYISCNPPTLARDLKLLKDIYKIGRLVFIDMFPQTKHCEVIAELTQNK